MTTTDAQLHWRRLERLYLGAPINEYFQPTIAVRDGEADVSVVVRHDFFHAQGCRLSDHGMNHCYADFCSEKTAAAIFAKARAGVGAGDAEGVDREAERDADKDVAADERIAPLAGHQPRPRDECRGPETPGCCPVGWLTIQ